MLVGKIERKFCDLNRPSSTAYEHENASHYHSAYHSTLTSFIDQVKQLSREKHNGMCLLVDLHGQSAMKGILYMDTHSLYLLIVGIYVDKSLRGTRNTTTVTHMIEKFGAESLIGEHSVLGYLNNHRYLSFP